MILMHKEGIHKQTGFTLVELLIVIIIIGVLVSLVIIVYSGVQERAMQSRSLSAVDTWEKAVRMIEVESGYTPVPQNDYQAACVGENFPADDDFPEGACVVMGDNDIVIYSDPDFNSLIRQKAGSVPDSKHPTIQATTSDGQPMKTRGWFHSSTFIYQLTKQGNNCGRGEAVGQMIMEGLEVTTCRITLPPAANSQ